MHFVAAKKKNWNPTINFRRLFFEFMPSTAGFIYALLTNQNFKFSFYFTQTNSVHTTQADMSAAKSRPPKNGRKGINVSVETRKKILFDSDELRGKNEVFR